jgi:uncharacterized protein (DUF362 family)
MILRIHTGATARLQEVVRSELRAALGHLNPKRIVLKPNWVLHETDPAFPIRALVTDARLIEATALVCLELFPQAESILVGDCPLQFADWPLMSKQSGLHEVIERLATISSGKIVFRDLRKEVFARVDGTFLQANHSEHGDPRGYRVVSLGERSHLEPISDQAEKFAVNDYTAAVTSSNHRRGQHNYFVSQSVLDADLFINLPKWKTHGKAGITAALKNLVGINGDKAYLPHFRRGAPKWGGDEYSDENRWLYWAQTSLREKLQKRSKLAFQLLKPGWEALKKIRGIETRYDNPSATPKHFYAAGGAWFGNETLWRMIYDLNLVIQCADREGRLQSTPQRHYYCLVDGLISGEGNGPLQPLPRETDWLLFGNDPFAMDVALAHFMGFDSLKIPALAHQHEYLGPEWGKTDFATLETEMDGRKMRLADSGINLKFIPPPGWRNHIER